MGGLVRKGKKCKYAIESKATGNQCNLRRSDRTPGKRWKGVPRWQPYRVAGPVQGTLDCHPVGKKVGERVLGLNKQIEERAAGQTRRAVHGDTGTRSGLVWETRKLRQLTKNAWCRFKSEEVIHL